MHACHARHKHHRYLLVLYDTLCDTYCAGKLKDFFVYYFKTQTSYVDTVLYLMVFEKPILIIQRVVNKNNYERDMVYSYIFSQQ
jgi:hypothetical protein